MLPHFSSTNPTAPNGSAEKSHYTQSDAGTQPPPTRWSRGPSVHEYSEPPTRSADALERPYLNPTEGRSRNPPLAGYSTPEGHRLLRPPKGAYVGGFGAEVGMGEAPYPSLFSTRSTTPFITSEYPDLINFNESTNFRIKKLMDDEKLLQDEIKFRSSLSKKYGRYATVADVLEWTLIAGDIVVGTVCAAIPGIGSAISTITFSGVGAISGFSKIVQAKLTAKKTKHRDLSIVAKTTLANLHHKISKAIADGQITHEEFEDIQSTINMWKNVRSGEVTGSTREPLLTPEMIQTLTENAQKELISRLQKSDSPGPITDRRRETLPSQKKP